MRDRCIWLGGTAAPSASSGQALGWLALSEAEGSSAARLLSRANQNIRSVVVIAAGIVLRGFRGRMFFEMLHGALQIIQ